MCWAMWSTGKDIANVGMIGGPEYCTTDLQVGNGRGRVSMRDDNA